MRGCNVGGFLDMISSKDDEFMTGYYYERRTVSPEDGRAIFKYSRLDPYSRVFDTQLGQMRIDTSCLVNIWIPDGFKDIPADRLSPRLRLKKVLTRFLPADIIKTK